MRIPMVALLLWAAAAGSVRADYFTEAIALGLEQEPLVVQRLAVASVSVLSGEENEVCRLYRERLTADLRQHTRYVIVERENLDALLEEIELSQNDISADARKLEVGRILNAQALLDLTIAELRDGTEMFVRLTDVETATILYARSFRDFAGEPESGAGSYDPERELAPDDYATASSAAGRTETERPLSASVGSASPPPVVLRPDNTQRAALLGAAYRQSLLQQRDELEINSRLYGLRSENPQLFRALTEARRGLRLIAQDRELLLLFVFHNRALADGLKEQHPLLARRLFQRFRRLQRENPRKDAFVRAFLARYGRLVARDRLLAELVRRRFEDFVREQ